MAKTPSITVPVKIEIDPKTKEALGELARTFEKVSEAGRDAAEALRQVMTDIREAASDIAPPSPHTPEEKP